MSWGQIGTRVSCSPNAQSYPRNVDISAILQEHSDNIFVSTLSGEMNGGLGIFLYA